MADADNSGGYPSEKPDLRYTKREDQGVSIQRDMSGSGRLARGSHTNMSSIRMSVRAPSRDYLDPELAALREPAPRSDRVQAVEAPEVAQRNTNSSQAVSLPEEPALPVQAQHTVIGRISNAVRRFLSGS